VNGESRPKAAHAGHGVNDTHAGGEAGVARKWATVLVGPIGEACER